jgi:predicted ArsR family transcriptional regulator
MLAPPAPPVVRLLHNPMNRAIIAELEGGPSFPRELAARLHVTEGQVQKHLHHLADAGLVEAAWHHDTKTVKRYELRVHGAHLTFGRGGIDEELDAAVGPKTSRARP